MQKLRAKRIINMVSLSGLYFSLLQVNGEIGVSAGGYNSYRSIPLLQYALPCLYSSSGEHPLNVTKSNQEV